MNKILAQLRAESAVTGSVEQNDLIHGQVAAEKSPVAVRVLPASLPVQAALREAPAIVGNVTAATGNGGTTDHRMLNGRDAADQHPMSSITGLLNALAKKPDGMEVTPEGLVYLTSGGERIAGPYGPFGSGGGSTNAAKLTMANTTGWLFNTVAAGRPCMVSANWSSLVDGISTGPGTLQVYVADTLKTTLNVEQGDVSVDVAGWLASGANTVKLLVRDAYRNEQELIYTIEVVAVSVRSNFDGNVVCTGPTSYYYTPVGAAVKTVYFLLDGEEIGRETVTVSNQQQDFIIPAQSHGSHTFEVYFTAKIGETDVESNHLYYDLIFTEEGRTEKVIASTFRPAPVEQFDTFVIPYRVYDPLSLTAEVVLAEDGVDLKELTVDRTEQQWSHRLDTVGESELTITSGDTVKRFTIPVIESSVKVTPVCRSSASILCWRAETAPICPSCAVTSGHGPSGGCTSGSATWIPSTSTANPLST